MSDWWHSVLNAMTLTIVATIRVSVYWFIGWHYWCQLMVLEWGALIWSQDVCLPSWWLPHCLSICRWRLPEMVVLWKGQWAKKSIASSSLFLLWELFLSDFKYWVFNCWKLNKISRLVDSPMINSCRKWQKKQPAEKSRGREFLFGIIQC